MKDFVREYWKIAAAFSAGAFLLSFLVGLVSRNPFGTVILRALLLAVVFAAFGAGVRYVARRWLPELIGGAGPAEEADTGRGKSIDITLPEERPDAGRRPRGVPAAAAAGRGEPSADEEEQMQAEAEALDELAEELGDGATGKAEEDGPGAAADAETAEEEGGEDERAPSEAEELRPLGREKGRGGPRPGPAGDAEGDLDALPDISNLEVAEEPGAPRSRAGQGRERPEDAVRGAMSGHDPSTIARAIRTVINRDEKG
jgi:hypothetical protein